MKNITLWSLLCTPAEFTLLKNDTKQVCTHIYRLEARKRPKLGTGHSLLGKLDLFVLGGCPLEADRVHCGRKEV